MNSLIGGYWEQTPETTKLFDGFNKYIKNRIKIDNENKEIDIIKLMNAIKSNSVTEAKMDPSSVNDITIKIIRYYNPLFYHNKILPQVNNYVIVDSENRYILSNIVNTKNVTVYKIDKMFNLSKSKEDINLEHFNKNYGDDINFNLLENHQLYESDNMDTDISSDYNSIVLSDIIKIKLIEGSILSEEFLKKFRKLYTQSRYNDIEVLINKYFDHLNGPTINENPIKTMMNTDTIDIFLKLLHKPNEINPEILDILKTLKDGDNSEELLQTIKNGKPIKEENMIKMNKLNDLIKTYFNKNKEELKSIAKYNSMTELNKYLQRLDDFSIGFNILNYMKLLVKNLDLEIKKLEEKTMTDKTEDKFSFMADIGIIDNIDSDLINEEDRSSLKNFFRSIMGKFIGPYRKGGEITNDIKIMIELSNYIINQIKLINYSRKRIDLQPIITIIRSIDENESKKQPKKKSKTETETEPASIKTNEEIIKLGFQIEQDKNTLNYLESLTSDDVKKKIGFYRENEIKQIKNKINLLKFVRKVIIKIIEENINDIEIAFVELSCFDLRTTNLTDKDNKKVEMRLIGFCDNFTDYILTYIRNSDNKLYNELYKLTNIEEEILKIESFKKTNNDWILGTRYGYDIYTSNGDSVINDFYKKINDINSIVNKPLESYENEFIIETTKLLINIYKTDHYIYERKFDTNLGIGFGSLITYIYIFKLFNLDLYSNKRSIFHKLINIGRTVKVDYKDINNKLLNPSNSFDQNRRNLDIIDNFEKNVPIKNYYTTLNYQFNDFDIVELPLKADPSDITIRKNKYSVLKLLLKQFLNNKSIYNEIKYKSVHVRGTPIPDCHDSAVRNFINVLIFENDKINIKKLPETVINEVKEFYTKYDSYEKQKKSEAHTDWLFLLNTHIKPILKNKYSEDIFTNYIWRNRVENIGDSRANFINFTQILSLIMLGKDSLNNVEILHGSAGLTNDNSKKWVKETINKIAKLTDSSNKIEINYTTKSNFETHMVLNGIYDFITYYGGHAYLEVKEKSKTLNVTPLLFNNFINTIRNFSLYTNFNILYINKTREDHKYLILSLNKALGTDIIDPNNDKKITNFYKVFLSDLSQQKDYVDNDNKNAIENIPFNVENIDELKSKLNKFLILNNIIYSVDILFIKYISILKNIYNEKIYNNNVLKEKIKNNQIETEYPVETLILKLFKYTDNLIYELGMEKVFFDVTSNDFLKSNLYMLTTLTNCSKILFYINYPLTDMTYLKLESIINDPNEQNYEFVLLFIKYCYIFIKDKIKFKIFLNKIFELNKENIELLVQRFQYFAHKKDNDVIDSLIECINDYEPSDNYKFDITVLFNKLYFNIFDYHNNISKGTHFKPEMFGLNIDKDNMIDFENCVNNIFTKPITLANYVTEYGQTDMIEKEYNLKIINKIENEKIIYFSNNKNDVVNFIEFIYDDSPVKYKHLIINKEVNNFKEKLNIKFNYPFKFLGMKYYISHAPSNTFAKFLKETKSVGRIFKKIYNEELKYFFKNKNVYDDSDDSIELNQDVITNVLKKYRTEEIDTKRNEYDKKITTYVGTTYIDKFRIIKLQPQTDTPLEPSEKLSGGYYEKYLKYKQKYIRLKNKIN